MSTGKPVLAPLALIVFCNKMPSHCAASLTVEVVKLDNHKRAQLRSIQQAVNKAIRPKADPPDIEIPWTENAKAGDCDDYALTKRGKLIDLGWPASALLLAVATVPDGEFHIVVVVVTDQGDFVLDNLRDDIVFWSELPYQWIKRSSPGNVQVWQQLEPGERVARPSCH